MNVITNRWTSSPLGASPTWSPLIAKIPTKRRSTKSSKEATSVVPEALQSNPLLRNGQYLNVSMFHDLQYIDILEILSDSGLQLVSKWSLATNSWIIPFCKSSELSHCVSQQPSPSSHDQHREIHWSSWPRTVGRESDHHKFLGELNIHTSKSLHRERQRGLSTYAAHFPKHRVLLSRSQIHHRLHRASPSEILGGLHGAHVLDEELLGYSSVNIDEGSTLNCVLWPTVQGNR